MSAVVGIVFAVLLLVALLERPATESRTGAWWAWAVVVVATMLMFAASVGLLQEVIRVATGAP